MTYRSALEFIDFQKDSFPEDFQKLLEEIYVTGATSITGGPSEHEIALFAKSVEALTFKRTGIRLKLITNSELGAAFVVPPNINSTLLSEIDVERVKDFASTDVFFERCLNLLEESKQKTGSIDLHKARVSGIFSEYLGLLYLNVDVMFQFKFSLRQITAIFLHELGHIFSFLAFSDRLNRTNETLAEGFKNQNKLDKKSRTLAIVTMEKAGFSKTAELLDKAKGPDVVLSSKMFESLKLEVKEMLPNHAFSQTQAEILADSFAARWGYGPDLASALVSLGTSGQSVRYQTRAGAFFGGAISLLVVTLGFLFFLLMASISILFISSGWAFFQGLVFAFFTVVYFFGWLGYLTSVSSSSEQSLKYDEIHHRLRRIRNQVVGQLRDLNLPKRDVEVILNHVKTLDTYIKKNTYERRSWFTVFIDFFDRSLTQRVDSEQFQRLLENLSANDLYLRAATFKTGASV